MTKRFKIVLGMAILLFIILASVFFVYDLEISKTLGSESPNWLFLLLDAVGEFPIYIGPIFFGLVYGFTNETKVWRLVTYLIGLVATYVGVVRLSSGVFEVFFNNELGLIQYILLALASLLIYILFFMWFNRVEKENIAKFRDIALVYLIVSATSFFIVTGIKYMWGRVRFRALDDNYSEFTNFLTINNFGGGFLGDDYRSFPSGHTNAASSILVLGLVVPRLFDKKFVKYLVWCLLASYVLLVAISRIGVMAHYASDVLFGFGISITCFIVTYFVFKKKGWLYVRSNKC